MELDPAQMAPRDRYKLMIGGIVPRPIAFVSTCDAEGRPNLAPFSFFCGAAAEPMTLIFCPANGPDGGPKDTLRNCDHVDGGRSGEFVVNVACDKYARQMAATAEELPYGESEFELSGLTPVPSMRVRPPRVAESPIAFECRTRQVIRLAAGVPGAGNIVIGEVVHIALRDDIVDDRYRIDPARLDAIGRMGGLGYCRTRDRFDLPMGRAALDG